MTQIKVELQEWMGNDRSIANAAWTSSYEHEKNQNRTDEDVARVINMLADSKHSVPFESVVFRFWIKLPLVADRQHMTHRIASHSGMSGRYRTMPSEWFEMPQDVENILLKITSNPGPLKNQYHYLCSEANRWYIEKTEFLRQQEKDGRISNPEFKRLREFFRGVLPQNNMTERVSLFNLRSFANYQKLRNSDHAQPEIREVAVQMLEQVVEKNICPVALDALKRNNWVI